MVFSRRRQSAVNAYSQHLRAEEFRIRKALCRRNKSVSAPSTSMPNISTVGNLDFGIKRRQAQQNDVHKFCQGKKCSESKEHTLAVKICHHSDCQDRNKMAPLLLCSECDQMTHSGNSNSHLRFDIPARLFKRTPSVKSQNSDSGTEEDGDNRFDKKNRGYASARRFFNMSSTAKKKVKRLPNEFQVPTKEMITIRFYDSATDEYESESIPAVKGISLKESVEAMFDARDLSFDTHSIFLEASHTPLPLAFETFPLGGNQLHVRANQDLKVDERIIAFARQEVSKETKKENMSAQNRGKKNILAYLGETDANSNSYQLNNAPMPGRRKSGASRQRQKDYVRTFQDLLEFYTVYGLEEEDIMQENDDEFFFMESSWTLVIDQQEGITKNQRDQQEAIWELLTTEAAYIEKLRAIVHVFLVCLRNVQNEGYLTEIVPVHLFSNIEEVYDANVKLWACHLRPVLEKVRTSRELLSPLDLARAFHNFDQLLSPYVDYCLEEPASLQYHKAKRKNTNFRDYLQWCENHKLCNRLKLSDLLVKPMQRVTKYPLLLKAILKKTQNEEEREALTTMINKVEDFVALINNTLRQRHEEQKMDDVISRLDGYLPVESYNDEMDKILLEHCTFDLRGRIPGLTDDKPRCVLKEGPLKIVEKQGRSDVYGFLFTDLFLLTKPKRGNEKCKIIKQPFRLNKVVLHPLLKDPGCFLFVYLNEYNVLVNAFIVQTTVTEQTKWIQAVEKAKRLYKDARAGNASTYDFFDDDLPFQYQTGSNSPRQSPLPQRRHTTSVEPSREGLLYEAHHVAANRNIRGQKQLSSSPDLLNYKRGKYNKVTRSISDPKERKTNQAVQPPLVQSRSGGSARRGNSENRFSVINEGDSRTWALTNDKRSRSDSLTTTILESVNSNSILSPSDSFRSVKSDTGLSRSPSTSDSDNSGFVKPSASAPNVSHLGVANSPNIRSHGGRAISQSSGVLSDTSSTSSVSLAADVSASSSQNLFSISDRHIERPLHDNRVPESGHLRRGSLSALNSTPEERNILFETMEHDDRLPVSLVDYDVVVKSNLQRNVSLTDQETQTDEKPLPSFTDSEIQVDDDDFVTHVQLTNENATQTECLHGNDYYDDCEVMCHSNLRRSHSENILTSSTVDFLESDPYYLPEKTVLKLSLSESELRTPIPSITHSRSFSDDSNNKTIKRRRNTLDVSPGMRALEVLSMSLESTLQSKKSPSNARRHRSRRKGLDSKQVEKQKSLRRITLLKRSPVPQRRHGNVNDKKSSPSTVSISDIERIERELKSNVHPKKEQPLRQTYSVSVTSSGKVVEMTCPSSGGDNRKRSMEYNGRIISADTIQQIKTQMKVEEALMYGEAEFV